MVIKTILILMTVLSSFSAFYSQEDVPKEKTKQLPSVAVGIGVLSFQGDIGKGANLSSFSKIKIGYNLKIEERIGKYLGVSLNGIYGKLADNENTPTRNLNFQSSIIEGDLNLLFHFDNDFIIKSNSSFAPFLSVGVGLLNFDSYGDLKDENGTPYQYWSDGSIRNIPETDPGAATSVIISRDYTYETKLIDNSTNYSRSTVTFPIGLCFNLKISDRLSTNIGATYFLTMSDWIDNLKSGSNDKFLNANFSLEYVFGKSKVKEESNARYKSVDFTALDNIDTDIDGVNDNLDVCPGTPKGIMVDSYGCPLDKDEDGIPDYLDKEPNSEKNTLVDQYGARITDKLIEEKNRRTELIATERSQLFNENPSLSTLRDFEEKSLDSRRNNSAILDIPYSLRSADKNKDGFISSDEITAALSDFFDSDSNYTVEKINDLIDFFFEQ